MCQTLIQILPTNTKQIKFCGLPTKLYDFSNNLLLENPKEIAEPFNTYFGNTDYLADKIPQTHPLQCKMYFKNRIQSSVFFLSHRDRTKFLFSKIKKICIRKMLLPRTLSKELGIF